MHAVRQLLQDIFGEKKFFQEREDIIGIRRFSSKHSYCCNEEGEIIGLAFCESNLKEIHLPKELSKLQYLNLSDSRKLRKLIIEVPLTELTHFDISNGEVAELHLPGSFESLEWLDVSRNKLKKLSFGGAMPRLKYLDGTRNELEELALDAENLKYLYLNENQLKSLRFLSVPRRLHLMQLERNKLEALPENFLEFENLKILYLNGNPLSQLPVEAFSDNEKENSLVNVRNYLRSLQADETIANDEVKLVLLGNSTSGKTTLVEYLMDKEFKTTLPSTHGINNILWKPEGRDYTVSIWDFGGQEFYHATHRLFLSNNAVTLVLFEEATNFQGEELTFIKLYLKEELKETKIPLQHFPYSYWLESIQYFSQKQLPEATILIQTKMDIPNTQIIEVSSVHREKFALQAANVLAISVKGAFEKQELFDLQYKMFELRLFQTLEKVKASYEISTKWLEIKKAIRERGKRSLLLSKEAYVGLCEEIRPGINKAEEGGSLSVLDTLTHYLHEIGVLLHYAEIPELEETVFINPPKITDIIYKVLDYKVIENEGAFDRDHVEAVLKDIQLETPLTAGQLIALMKRFELIFEVQGLENLFVAPQYLPKDKPAKSNKAFWSIYEECKEHLFTIRYPNFLPRSVMTRFICRYGNFSKDTFWHDGILFKKERIFFRIECTNGQEIRVHTEEAAPHLIAEIFTAFEDINRRNPAIEISLNGKDFVKSASLKNHPPQNPQIETIDGRWIDFEGFNSLLGRAGFEDRIGKRKKKRVPERDKVEVLDTVKALVAKNRLQEAIELLLEIAPDDLLDTTIGVMSRWTELRRQIMKKTILSENAEVERNQIISAVLELRSLNLSKIVL